MSRKTPGFINWGLLGALALGAALILGGPVAGAVVAGYAASAAGLPLAAVAACGLAGLVAGGLLSPFTRGFLTKGGPNNRFAPKKPAAPQAPAPDTGSTRTLVRIAAQDFGSAAKPSQNENTPPAPAPDKKSAPPQP